MRAQVRSARARSCMSNPGLEGNGRHWDRFSGLGSAAPHPVAHARGMEHANAGELRRGDGSAWDCAPDVSLLSADMHPSAMRTIPHEHLNLTPH